MEQPASVCGAVLESPDVELLETDEHGQLLTYGKVAAAAVVGNEDGAHHTTAEGSRRSTTSASPSWRLAAHTGVGEPCRKVDYADASPKPDTTGAVTKDLAVNAAHLARLLADIPYEPLN